MTPDDERNMTLASQGDARAQYNVAFMYYIGKGVPRDKEKAKEWLKKSAAQGYIEAQDQLSALFNIEIVGTPSRTVRKSSTGDNTGGKEPEKTNARLISCPVCEKMVSSQAETCLNCGQPIRSAPKSAKKEDAGRFRNSKNCPACGEKIPFEATQCQYCQYTYKSAHSRQESSTYSSSSTSSTTKPTQKIDKPIDIASIALLVGFVLLGIVGTIIFKTAPDVAPKEIFEPSAMYAVEKLVGLTRTDMKNARASISDVKDVRNYTIVLDGEKWKCTEMTASLHAGGTHKVDAIWEKNFPMSSYGSPVIHIKIAYIKRGNQYEYKGIDVSVIKK